MDARTKKKIAALQLKISALGRVIDETDSALAELLEQEEQKPAPRQRQNKKQSRIVSAEQNFNRYNRRKKAA